MRPFFKTLLVILFLATPVVGQDAAPEDVLNFDAYEAASAPYVTGKDLAQFLVALDAKELSKLAEVWKEHLSTNLRNIAAVGTRSDEAELTQAEQDRLGKMKGLTYAIQDRYAQVLQAWQRKGADEEDTERHWNYLAGTDAQLVLTADIPTLVTLTFEWLTSLRGGLSFVLKVSITIAAFWLLSRVAGWTRWLAKKWLRRFETLSELSRELLLRAVYWGVICIGTALILARLGVNMTVVAAVVGGIGLLLAFSIQNVLGNIASGIMIALVRPFDLGDVIGIGETTGTVEGLGLSATLLRGFDNLLIAVPNEQIWKSQLRNYTEPGILRIDLEFHIGFREDIDRAVSILRELVDAHPGCLKTPEPMVFMAEIGEASVAIYCRAWAQSESYWIVGWDLTERAKRALDAAGITTAYPLYGVQLSSDEERDENS